MYINEAPEPTREPVRRVQFQVFDEQFESNVITGMIRITLINDNRLMLACGGGRFEFIEESQTPIMLASSLSLSDRDSDHVVLAARVSVTNAQEGDEISILASNSSSVSVQQVTSTLVELSGSAMAMQYQVSNFGSDLVRQLVERM